MALLRNNTGGDGSTVRSLYGTADDWVVRKISFLVFVPERLAARVGVVIKILSNEY